MASGVPEEDVPSMAFGLVCSCLEELEKNSRNAGRKAACLRILHRLLQAARSRGELYAVVRLLIPKRDVERQHYNLKESTIAVLLIEALGIGAESNDGMLLNNWKRASNFAAGDFAGLAMQVVSRRQSIDSSNLSVAELNLMLDMLAKSSKRQARVDITRNFLKSSKALELKWLIRIILKDLKIGLGENTILDVLHEDARAMMATCIDLKRVCAELHDPKSHPFRRELVLGKVLKSQHSKRMNSVEAAWGAADET
ncbi:hypothetical protein KP509_17G068600 [Ceratopteris richardii]|uniref:DNA ligase ATP-dependent N-terminal domain-containing protein n=1 Tax=Ceratopteris richardii TaxID=49495 RepID=A0A8T2SZ63_CERRI|nr:hypothetical protein KP509_17G068600 [Ceratopteris richardii]